MSAPRRSGGSSHADSYVTCMCGKRGYRDKKHARAAIRRMPEASELHTYRCPSRPESAHRDFEWHVGHIVPRRFRETGAGEC